MKKSSKNTEKIQYEIPKMEVLWFGQKDVVRTSDEGQKDPFDNEW